MNGTANVRISGSSLVELVCVPVCTLLFLFTALSICLVVLGRHTAGTRDYIEYWASGQQLVHHRNPYNITEILKLERAEGLPDSVRAMVMGNAPPALLLTYPLGFVDAQTGQYVWMFVLLGSLVASVRLLRSALETHKQIVSIIGYTFGPALVCIAAGQMAILVLLGLSIFLRFYKDRPFIAGAALWLCLFKPQILMPFGVVMCVWIWRHRQLKLFAGTVSALSVSAGLVWVLDPNCWGEYREMMRLMRYDQVIIPCLSMVLRDSMPRVPIVQYAPAALGSVWAMAFFWKHKRHWDWIKHGSNVLLVSLLTPPYTWFIDQCVALPALLRGATVTRSRMMVAILALATAVIEFGPFTKHELMHSKWYLWTTPFYLIWYLVSTRGYAKTSSADIATASSEACDSPEEARV